MNKYLNANDLILKIMANATNNQWILLTTKDTDLYHTVANTKALAKIINEMPSADVVDVKHGEWQRTNPMTDTIECSLCHYQIISEELITPFCPWCGADMRGETDE